MKKLFTFLCATMLAGQAWAAVGDEFTGENYLTFNETTYARLKYKIISDNEVSLIGYESNYQYNFYSLNLVIGPTITNGDVTYSITSIEDDALRSAKMSSITINGVSSIGTSAFRYCYELQSITLSGVESIGESAFDGCQKLNSVSLPNTLKNIGEYAFNYCTNLITLTVPDNVETIGNNAFYGVSSIIYDGDAGDEDDKWGARLRNAYIKDTYFAYEDANFKTLALYLGSEAEVTIPDGTETIKGAFENNSSLTSVTIPASVKEIGMDAFRMCVNLTTVNIPATGVTTIRTGAFAVCSSLESIDIPSTTTRIEGGVFTSCKALKSISIPEGAVLSGSDIFSYCSDLTSVSIPEGTTEIPTSTFEECSSLKSITIPSTVTSIGSDAFKNCTSLEAAKFASLESMFAIEYGNEDSNPLSLAHNLYINNVAKTELEIPDNITSIPDNIFAGFSSLTSVSIPSTVTSIGADAFKDCTSLEEVNFASVESFFNTSFANAKANPLSNGGKLLIAGEELTNLVIPSNVTAIPDKMFIGFSSLASLTIPANVKSIGEQAFSDCSGLTSLTIAEGLETIDTKAFQKCNSLTSVIIPQSLTEIGQQAFYNCTGLTAIVIPSNVKKVGKKAFNDCSNLSIYCECDENNVPSNWDSQWNYSSCPVNYGCKYLTISTNNTDKGNATVSDYSAVGYNKTMWYTNGATATLTATPNENCHVKWEDNTTANNRTIEMTGNKSVTATFENCTPAPGVAEAATCTAKGHTAGSFCSVCGFEFEAQQETDKIPHLFTDYQYNDDATYDADGTETAYCDYNCGASQTRTAEGTKLQNPTVIGTESADELTISVSGHSIVVENATEVIYLFDITGHPVSHQSPMAQNVFEVQNHGVYVVKCSNMSKKVVIK
ncbi:MAG: leucine-rich repeat domain-containing protein [Bacteroidales bacterium]|nr:leucine-rich repeat domain-containing protein [Bacteroidales bacterium]